MSSPIAKTFLIVMLFLFVIFSVPSQADCEKIQASISYLLDRGFTRDLDRFGVSSLLPNITVLESRFMIKKARRINFSYFYNWIDNNILFEIHLLSREYANIVVVAFILEESSYERWQETLHHASIRTIPNAPRFGEHAGRTYVTTTPFFRVNEDNFPPTKFIGIDIDGDGIIQEGEGRYVFF